MFLTQDLSSLYYVFSDSVTSARCKRSELEQCRDESEALILKLVAMASILAAGLGGIAIPLAGKWRREGEAFMAAKALAAGVILATGFVHMLRDSWEALSDPCLGGNWNKFPFTGFFAMVSALLTLLFDFFATGYYQRREERGKIKDFVQENEALLLETGIVELVHAPQPHPHDVQTTLRHVVVSQEFRFEQNKHYSLFGR